MQGPPSAPTNRRPEHAVPAIACTPSAGQANRHMRSPVRYARHVRATWPVRNQTLSMDVHHRIHMPHPAMAADRRRCNADGVQVRIDLTPPEIQELLEAGILWHEVDLLPDIGLQQRRMIRHAIKDLGGGQACSRSADGASRPTSFPWLSNGVLPNRSMRPAKEHVVGIAVSARKNSAITASYHSSPKSAAACLTSRGDGPRSLALPAGEC